MIKLSKNQILKLHEELINEFEGIHGVRDEELLDLSLNSHFQTFGGSDLYQGTIKKVAHLAFFAY